MITLSNELPVYVETYHYIKVETDTPVNIPPISILESQIDY